MTLKEKNYKKTLKYVHFNFLYDTKTINLPKKLISLLTLKCQLIYGVIHDDFPPFSNYLARDMCTFSEACKKVDTPTSVSILNVLLNPRSLKILTAANSMSSLVREKSLKLNESNFQSSASATFLDYNGY